MGFKKTKKKNIFVVVALLVACGLTLFILLGNKSLEQEIVGSWITIEGEECLPSTNEIITFRKDKVIEGLEGFSDYRIQETDHNEYDYAILSGHYEDATRYRIKISDEVLSIVYEEGDTYDFESAIACHMTKE